MRLNEKQKELFKEKFAEFFTNRICSICSYNHWLVTDDVFDLKEYNPSGNINDSKSNPVVPVVCSKCGNTHLINLAMYDINL